MNAHFEDNLAHTLTAFGDELNRFNLEFSDVRLQPQIPHYPKVSITFLLSHPTLSESDGAGIPVFQISFTISSTRC